MPALTPELVSRYIESAQPFVESRADRLVLQLADDLNTPPTYHWNTSPEQQRRRNPHVENPEQSKAESEVVRSLQELVLAEIHAALCKKAVRYRKNVNAIRDNVHLLIGGIAVQVAGKLGFAVAIVTALVAALLRVVLQMGVTVFCKKFKSALF